MAASKDSLSVDFVEPHWRFTVHPQTLGWWVAEIHDLDECQRQPDVLIAPLSHMEGENKVVVAGSALEQAISAQGLVRKASNDQ